MDHFENATDSLIAPAKAAFPIAPNDSQPLPVTAKAIYVGSGGDLVMRAVDSGENVRFANVASGSILPIRVTAVLASGTTASDLVGLI